MKDLLKQAIANAVHTGVPSWFDRLPRGTRDVLAKARREYWEQGAPCSRAALFRTCKQELKLNIKEGAFSEWINKGKPA